MATVYTVIGLGAFGRSAALALQSLGNTVIGIDRNAKMVEELNEQIPHVIIADVTSKSVLEEINVAQSAGVLVSIGEDLEASLLCVLNLKQLGVSNIWVKVKNQAHQAILMDMGIKNFIRPEISMGKRIAQKMHFPQMQDMLTVSPDCILMVLDMPAREHPLTLAELMENRTNTELLALYREQALIKNFADDIVLEAGDRLIFTGAHNALRPLIKYIRGQ